MGLTVVDSLPADFFRILDSAVLQCETDPNIIHTIKSTFLNDVEKGSGFHHIWNVYGFTLTKHDAPYSHVQVYQRQYLPDEVCLVSQAHANDDADVAILITKTHAGKMQVYFFLGNTSIALVNSFKSNKTDFKQVSTQASTIREQHFLKLTYMWDGNPWDNLKVYGKGNVWEFYTENNYHMSCHLTKVILEGSNKNHLTIINLGCGTDLIFDNLAKQLEAHQSNNLKNIEYIGIDNNAPSIESRKVSMANKNPMISAQWICRDALEAVQDQSLFDELNGDIYLIASGLLNYQVLAFDDAVKIMQALRNQPSVKRVYITGLTQTFISSYIGKQIGFESSLLNSTTAAGQSGKAIELFAPMEHEKWKKRFILKAEKRKTLDLSFVKNLSSIIDIVTQENVKCIEHVLLFFTDFNQDDMIKFQQWTTCNPKLLFVASSMNPEQHEKMLFQIRTSPARWHFAYQGIQYINPIKSPEFFRSFKDSNHLDSLLGEGYAQILKYRLWITLNEDKSDTDDAITAKNDIHSMINGMSFYFEKDSKDDKETITTEDFLEYLTKSGISSELYAAAENYIRMVPIKLFSDQKYFDEGYRQYVTIGDQSLKSYQLASKLHEEGVINDKEWSLLQSRYEQARNSDKNKGANTKK